jgi:hypothetical protein
MKMENGEGERTQTPESAAEKMPNAVVKLEVEKSDTTAAAVSPVGVKEKESLEAPREGTTAWLQVLGAFCLNLNTWYAVDLSPCFLGQTTQGSFRTEKLT